MPILNMGSWVALGMLAGLAMASQDTHAAWHDKHFGTDLRVHFVHLTGYAGDNSVNRRNLLIEHEGCASRRQAFGETASPLPPEGVPAIPHPEDVEIYYAPNRTLTVTQGAMYSIDFATCALVAIPHHRLELRSAIGLCEIDLIKKEARGVCDVKAHERAPSTTLGRIAPAKVPAVDLDRLPPAMRAEVEAHIERLKASARGSAGLSGGALVATGASKVIADFKCDSYRATALNAEVCIAHPLSTFPIPAAPLNGAIPGLLLDAKSPWRTLHAQQVTMNLTVSNDLFALPPGLKVKNIASPRVHP